jgi:hypothetical protein
VLELGTLKRGVVATVDDDGVVRYGTTTLTASIVGDAGRARTQREGTAPVAQTSWRVAHGDAIQRVYAVDDAVVVEIENASPDAIAVALAVDGTARLSLPRKPGDVRADGAVVFPIPHRVRLRVALADANLDVRALADVDAVVRGWAAVLDRGLRTELPEPLQTEIDVARADLLLTPRSARARRFLDDVCRALLQRRRKTLMLLPGFRSEWLGANIAVHDFPLRRGVASFAVRWHAARPALLWDVPAGFRVTVPALDPNFTSHEAAGEALLAEPPAELLAMGRTTTVDGTAIDAPESFA